MATKRDEIFDRYAQYGGPVPARGAGSTASAFWRGYRLGAAQKGLRGGAKGSVADKAFRAGIARRKVQDNLTADQQ